MGSAKMSADVDTVTLVVSKPNNARDSIHPELRRVLEETFGFDQLRPGQAEVISDVMEGRPVIAIMPTGAGKSLCYQLPAVVLAASGGVTLVVSPLIALMKDQVDGLSKLGISSAALTSAVSPAEQHDILEGIRGGVYELIYVAPERFRSSRFIDALSAIGDRLALVAIDEAHCISEWGHEFRPAYRLIGDVLAKLKPPRIVALTATATPEVQQDIVRQLGLDNVVLHVRGFARPNLTFSVEIAAGAADKCQRLVEKVRTRPSGVALVYASTRKNAEKYSAALDEAGMRTRVYHAGLDDSKRTEAQDLFMAGKLDVIVATNAFGMGVDKANIRTLVHADVPRSPEAYYQEAGRAGRDGEPAHCVLLFNHGDVRLQEFLIDASHPSTSLLRSVWRVLREDSTVGSSVETLREALPDRPHPSAIKAALRVLDRHGYLETGPYGYQATLPDELPGHYPPMDTKGLERRERVERDKLKKMVEYAYDVGCRHRFVLRYFGDAESERLQCAACDNCKGTGHARPLDDAQREHVVKLLNLVWRLDGRFGRSRLAALANGTDDDNRFLDLEERATLRGQSTAYLIDLLRSLDSADLVSVSRGDYPTLSITARGEEVVSGNADLGDISIALSRRGKKTRKRRARGTQAVDAPCVEDDADFDVALAQRLKELRTGLAAQRAVPAYVIFSNRTLEAIARAQPQSLGDLSEVSGIGPAKLTTFGDAILSAVQKQDQ